MKGIGAAFMILLLASTPFRCAQGPWYDDPCDRELARHEPCCEAGFGYRHEGRTYLLCMNGDTAEALRSWRGPRVTEKAAKYANLHGVAYSPWGRFIDLSGECGCMEEVNHVCGLQ